MHKIKLYSVFLTVLAIIFGIALIILINILRSDNLVNLLLFYFLIAGLVFSATTVTGYYFRRRFGVRELFNLYFSQSSRQGLWFTILILTSLFLLSRDWFTWLNASFLVLTLICLEAYLLTKKNNINN